MTRKVLSANGSHLCRYDKDSYLVPNPINRYALGDRSNMKLGDDGSLTIYIQNESPGKGKERNWLPSPEGFHADNGNRNATAPSQLETTPANSGRL